MLRIRDCTWGISIWTCIVQQTYRWWATGSDWGIMTRLFRIASHLNPWWLWCHGWCAWELDWSPSAVYRVRTLGIIENRVVGCHWTSDGPSPQCFSARLAKMEKTIHTRDSWGWMQNQKLSVLEIQVDFSYLWVYQFDCCQNIGRVQCIPTDIVMLCSCSMYCRDFWVHRCPSESLWLSWILSQFCLIFGIVSGVFHHFLNILLSNKWLLHIGISRPCPWQHLNTISILRLKSIFSNWRKMSHFLHTLSAQCCFL